MCFFKVAMNFSLSTRINTYLCDFVTVGVFFLNSLKGEISLVISTFNHTIRYDVELVVTVNGLPA